MSNYRNFITDFPTRCGKLFVLEPLAKEQGLEVTLLLALGTQAILVPYERLQANHPSLDGTSALAAPFRELLRSCCSDSPLFRDSEGAIWAEWKITDCRPEIVHKPEVEGLEEIGDEKCDAIIYILRNALAHGSIWTDGEPIDRLVFASAIRHGERVVGYNRIECSPDSFRRFVCAWITTLSRIDHPQTFSAARRSSRGRVGR